MRKRIFMIILAAGCVLSRTDFAIADPDSGDAVDRRAIAIEALSRLKGMDLEANPAMKNAVLKVLETTRGTADFVKIVDDFQLKGQERGLLEVAEKNPND